MLTKTDVHSLPVSLLVVDEDARMRAQISEVLQNRGHRVVAVDETGDAIERLSEEKFDVVLSAWNLSEVDGLTFLSRVREYDANQEAIFVGSEAELESVIPLLGPGIADYVFTPVNEETLLPVVEACLERSLNRRARDGSGRELSEAAQLVEIASRGLELFGLSDVDALHEKILEEFSLLTDAQSAALWLLEDTTEFRLVAHRGLFERASHHRPWMRDENLLHRVIDGTPWMSTEGQGSSFNVPLKAFREPVGLVQLADPLHREFRPESQQWARHFSEFSSVALRNGRRLKSLERLGLRDRETSAYNLSYFTDYSSKEIYKARRYGRVFSLITFSIDHLAQLRHRFGPEQAQRATRGVIRTLTRIARDTDVIAKAGDQEFFMLLPETDHFGSMSFLRRATMSIAIEPDVEAIESRFPLGIVGGIATFPKDGEDFDDLMASCYRRMGERRTSLQGKLLLDPMPFWDSLVLLLGTPNSPSLPIDDQSPSSHRGNLAPGLFDALQQEVVRELERDPHSRGVVFLGVPEIRRDLPLLKSLERQPADMGTRVFVLGRRADLTSHNVAALVFLEAEERLRQTKFLLWLSEHSAFASIQSTNGSEWSFQTSDGAVVESLIARLQAEYELQPT